MLIFAVVNEKKLLLWIWQEATDEKPIWIKFDLSLSSHSQYSHWKVFLKLKTLQGAFKAV